VNFLYLSYLSGTVGMPAPYNAPTFGIAHKDIAGAQDLTAHSFGSDVCQVAMCDGSVRSVSKSVASSIGLKLGTPSVDVTTWQWACSYQGTIGGQPKPAGW